MTNSTAPSDADLIARLRNDHNNQTSVDAANRLAEMQQKTDGLNQTLAGTYVRAEKAERAITELRQALAEREATIATVKVFADQNRKSTSTARLVIAGDLDPILSAAPGDALSARLAEVERQRDRAEQCIEQVRNHLPIEPTFEDYENNDRSLESIIDALAAYDAARETPAPALHDNEMESTDGNR